MPAIHAARGTLVVTARLRRGYISSLCSALRDEAAVDLDHARRERLAVRRGLALAAFRVQLIHPLGRSLLRLLDAVLAGRGDLVGLGVGGELGVGDREHGIAALRLDLVAEAGRRVP